jgi:2-phospho-L-lactate guanylyltransferase (CobY/MobA/RfbA family)
VVLQLAGVALDVDRPEDLVQLTAAPGDTRAQRLAREWVILEKIPAAS